MGSHNAKCKGENALEIAQPAAGGGRPGGRWSCSRKARRLGAAWREKLETLLLLPPLEDEDDVDDRSVSGASCLVGATCCSRSSQELAAHCQ